MTIIIGILFAAVILLSGVVYEQKNTIKRQKRLLFDALDWIDPAEIVLPEDWNE